MGQQLRTVNCDLTGDHILLMEKDGRWRLSGVIDFGDAMVAPPLFEFAVPLLCLCEGKPALARALVEEYGERLTKALTEEIMSYLFLHAFINLQWIQEVTHATTPGSLMENIWGYLCSEAQDKLFSISYY